MWILGRIAAFFGLSQLRLALYGTLALSLIGAAGGLYLKGRTDCGAASREAALQQQVAFLREEIERRDRIIAESLADAAAHQKAVDDLEQKLRELQEATNAEDGDPCGIGRDFLNGLR